MSETKPTTNTLPGKLVLLGLAGIFVIAFVFAWNTDDNETRTPANTREDSSSRSEVLAERLSYINNNPDVAWMEIENNNVYIGFWTIPSNLDSVVGGAAFFGNEAIDFGVHVWATTADKGWRPGDPGFFCKATARYGTNQDNSC